MDKIYAIIPVSHFDNAKTRLSPFLSLKERENLLKAMLLDVCHALKDSVQKIVIVSKDKNVLKYAEELGAYGLVENDDVNGLNDALKQAMDWAEDKCKKIIITPSDVPLIAGAQIDLLIKQSENVDFIIAPSKGAGTNALIMKPNSIDLMFGDFSFFNHIKEAELKGLKPFVIDSFFISLDVNTTEDLGEIILHGNGTNAQKYLNSINLDVKSFHGSERLKVSRK